MKLGHKVVLKKPSTYIMGRHKRMYPLPLFPPNQEKLAFFKVPWPDSTEIYTNYCPSVDMVPLSDPAEMLKL